MCIIKRQQPIDTVTYKIQNYRNMVVNQRVQLTAVCT
jgi:hypothetical protein